MGRHGRALPASQAACRSAVYSGSDKCAASRLASVRQYAGDVDGSDPQRLDAVDAFQHGAHIGITFGMQQQARAWLHAGDALRHQAV